MKQRVQRGWWWNSSTIQPLFNRLNRSRINFDRYASFRIVIKHAL